MPRRAPLAAQLAGRTTEACVSGYYGAMKANAVWAERGTSMENPYCGKAMLNWGVLLKASR